MILNPKDLLLSAYPPAPTGGMQTGRMPNGVKIVHIPTGLFAVCENHRHQHRNKEAALAELEAKVKAVV